MSPAAARARPLAQLLLTMAAALGTVALACVLVTTLTGTSLVVFRTGSMAPTIPAGSVALVRPVAAERVKVGDVVTVARADEPLPITHRVVRIEPVPGVAAVRSLTLRGDANATADPLPYRAEDVGLVLGSVPALGSWLSWWGRSKTSTPVVVALAALLLWAWWPRSRAAGLQVAS